jgi:hypothetical protein
MMRQHPPGEKPSIVVMFAEPPSVVGIAGGQMVEGALGVPADCVEMPSPSPGNSSGACGFREVDARIPLLPAEEPDGVTDPFADLLVVVAGVPVENEDMEDGVDVGTPRVSVPVFTVV